MPLENNILRDARYFQPALRKHKHTPNAVTKMAFSIRKVLGKDKMKKVFNAKSYEIEYDLSDGIKHESVEYQVEKIPKSFFFKDNATNSNKGRKQTLY